MDRTLTDEDLEGFGRRIADQARDALEADDKAWFYLPSFRLAVAMAATAVLKSVVQHERNYISQARIDAVADALIIEQQGRHALAWYHENPKIFADFQRTAERLLKAKENRDEQQTTDPATA